MPRRRTASTDSKKAARGPRLQDVAAAAGVSSTTASLVLSGRASATRISEACVKRVQAAATSLGYRGNYHARTLSEGRCRVLGMLVGLPNYTTVDHFFFSSIYAGAELGARQRGYDLLLTGGIERGSGELERALQILADRRVDALVLIANVQYLIPPAFSDSAMPVVAIGRNPQLVNRHSVIFDPGPGINSAADHLHRLGHRRILLVPTCDAEGAVHEPERIAHWRTAGAAQGLSIELRPLVVPHLSSNFVDDQVEAFARGFAALAMPPGITAIIAYNDLKALGILSVLRQRHVRVPQDLSLIGFDNQAAIFADPPLTSISHSLLELGLAAAGLAVDLVEGRAGPPSDRFIPSVLFRRGTTGPAPG